MIVARSTRLSREVNLGLLKCVLCNVFPVSPPAFCMFEMSHITAQ